MQDGELARAAVLQQARVDALLADAHEQAARVEQEAAVALVALAIVVVLFLGPLFWVALDLE